jgi:ADP-heptose:LPS heptosyltransferase
MIKPPPTVDVFFCNGLGDAVMALPALLALKEQLGERLRVFTDNRALREIFAGGSQVTLAPLATGMSAHGRRSIAAPERFNYDDLGSCIVWMNTWLDAEFLRAVAARERLVISAFEESHRRIHWDAAEHDFEKYFRFAQLFGAGNLDRYFAWPCERRPTRYWQSPLPSRPLVVLHLETTQAKMMDPADEAEVLSGLAGSFPDVLFVAVGNGNLREGGQRPTNLIELAGLNLRASIGLIARAQAFVGYDSCFLHAADLIGVPAVGLFRSTPVVEFGVFRTRGGCVPVLSSPPDIERLLRAKLEELLSNQSIWRTWRDAGQQRYWSRLRVAEKAGAGP